MYRQIADMANDPNELILKCIVFILGHFSSKRSTDHISGSGQAIFKISTVLHIKQYIDTS